MKTKEISTYDDYNREYKSLFREYEQRFLTSQSFNPLFQRGEILSNDWNYIQGNRNFIDTQIPNTFTENNDIDLVIKIKTDGIYNVCNEYDLWITRDEENLIYLNHSIISSIKDPIIADQSNGIILDEADNYKILGHSFNKIPFATEKDDIEQFNWDCFTVYEKVDGHKGILFFHGSTWKVASEYIIDARNNVAFKTVEAESKSKDTFKDTFWRVWEEKGYSDPPDQDCSYTFNLVLPEYRKVARYPESDIIFISIKNCRSFSEIDLIEGTKNTNWRLPRIFSGLTSFEKLLEASNNLNLFSLIGYVAVDDTFNRFQVTNTEYIAARYSIGFANKLETYNLSANYFDPESYIEIVRLNEKELFLKYLPRWEPYLEEQTAPYYTFLEKMNSLLSRVEFISDSKQFSQHISKFTKQEKSLLYSLRTPIGFHKPENLLAGLIKSKLRLLLTEQ